MPPPLHTLGPFEIVRTLAVGGQAKVLLGRREGPGGFAVHHALKVVELGPLGGARLEDVPEARTLITEARLLTQLKSPHTLTAEGLHALDDRLVMVMEYVAGRSLATLLHALSEQGTLLPLPHALWIARCVLMALEQAHALSDHRGAPLRVVHRDVTPENILLGFDGRVKLIDFGIAISRMASRNTQLGMIKGKLHYLSPEQASGFHGIDHRTDIYAAGLVLYEMVTGRKPLAAPDGRAEETHHILERARAPQIAPPRTLNEKLPPALDAILGRALQREADQRYPRAREMMVACCELLHTIAPRYCGDELGPFVSRVLSEELRSDQAQLRDGTQVALPSSGPPPAPVKAPRAQPVAPMPVAPMPVAPPPAPVAPPLAAQAPPERQEPRTPQRGEERDRTTASRPRMRYVASQTPPPQRRPLPPLPDDATRLDPPRAGGEEATRLEPAPSFPAPDPAEEAVDLEHLLQAIEDLYDERSGGLSSSRSDESTRIFKRR